MIKANTSNISFLKRGILTSMSNKNANDKLKMHILCSLNHFLNENMLAA